MFYLLIYFANLLTYLHKKIIGGSYEIVFFKSFGLMHKIP